MTAAMISEYYRAVYNARLCGNPFVTLLRLIVTVFITFSTVSGNSCLPLGVETSPSDIHYLEQPLPYFGATIQAIQQLFDGSVTLYDWSQTDLSAGVIFSFRLDSHFRNQKPFYSTIKNTQLSLISIVAQIVASNGEVAKQDFVPTFAVVMSWKLSHLDNASTQVEMTHQVIIATDAASGDTYVVLKFCSGDWSNLSSPASKTLLLYQRNPVVNFAPIHRRRAEYVFRVDGELECGVQVSDFYCATDPPHNFTIVEVTSRTAEFHFRESLSESSIGGLNYLSIEYSITCSESTTNEYVVAASNDTSEEKTIFLTDLSPYHYYECTLVKYVQDYNITIEADVVLQFRTLEDVPNIAPENITISGRSTTSVTLQWSSLSPKQANGNVQYFVNMTSISTPSYSINLETYSTRVILPGLQRDTMHVATITAYTREGWGPTSEIVSFRTTEYDHTHSSSTTREMTSYSAELQPSATSISADVATTSIVVAHIILTSSDSFDVSNSNRQATILHPHITKSSILPNSGNSIPTTHFYNVDSVTATGSLAPSATNFLDNPNTSPVEESFEVGDLVAILLGVIYVVTLGLIVTTVFIICLRKSTRRNNRKLHDGEVTLKQYKEDNKA